MSSLGSLGSVSQLSTSSNVTVSERSTKLKVTFGDEIPDAIATPLSARRCTFKPGEQNAESDISRLAEPNAESDISRLAEPNAESDISNLAATIAQSALYPKPTLKNKNTENTNGAANEIKKPGVVKALLLKLLKAFKTPDKPPFDPELLKKFIACYLTRLQQSGEFIDVKCITQNKLQELGLEAMVALGSGLFSMYATHDVLKKGGAELFTIKDYHNLFCALEGLGDISRDEVNALWELSGLKQNTGLVLKSTDLQRRITGVSSSHFNYGADSKIASVENDHLDSDDNDNDSDDNKVADSEESKSERMMQSQIKLGHYQAHVANPLRYLLDAMRGEKYKTGRGNFEELKSPSIPDDLRIALAHAGTKSAMQAFGQLQDALSKESELQTELTGNIREILNTVEVDNKVDNKAGNKVLQESLVDWMNATSETKASWRDHCKGVPTCKEFIPATNDKLDQALKNEKNRYRDAAVPCYYNVLDVLSGLSDVSQDQLGYLIALLSQEDRSALQKNLNASSYTGQIMQLMNKDHFNALFLIEKFDETRPKSQAEADERSTKRPHETPPKNEGLKSLLVELQIKCVQHIQVSWQRLSAALQGKSKLEESPEMDAEFKPTRALTIATTVWLSQREKPKVDSVTDEQWQQFQRQLKEGGGVLTKRVHYDFDTSEGNIHDSLLAQLQVGAVTAQERKDSIVPAETLTPLEQLSDHKPKGLLNEISNKNVEHKPKGLFTEISRENKATEIDEQVTEENITIWWKRDVLEPKRLMSPLRSVLSEELIKNVKNKITGKLERQNSLSREAMLGVIVGEMESMLKDETFSSYQNLYSGGVLRALLRKGHYAIACHAFTSEQMQAAIEREQIWLEKKVVVEKQFWERYTDETATQHSTKFAQSQQYSLENAQRGGIAATMLGILQDEKQGNQWGDYHSSLGSQGNDAVGVGLVREEDYELLFQKFRAWVNSKDDSINSGL